MKKIELDEMKKIELEALKYIDDICKKNGINYTLIGGSLIGAIRHNGVIPWDDDIDIGMTLENYLKFKNIINNNDYQSNYILLSFDNNNDYYYPFSKLIDKRTIMKEDGLKEIKNYGVFIDIFIYSGIPNNVNKRKRHYKKIKKVQKLLTLYALKDINDKNFLKKMVKVIIKKIIEFIGIEKIIRYSEEVCRMYDKNDTEYLISNWPIYGIEKDTQLTKIFEKYEYHKFENVNAQIISDYDVFLKRTFGDYMKLPPENERNPKHGLETYWR